MSALVFSGAERRTSRGAVTARTAHVKHFDLIFALLGLWPVAGLFMDVWAHNHVAALETFFTPWHGVLYSGFAATASYLAWTIVREYGLRAGYGLSLVGPVVFACAGVGDLLWHQVFGIEQGVEALFSPTPILPRDEVFHLQMHGVLGMLVYSGLLTGIVLMVVVRWTLPLGALTFVFGVNGVLMSTTHDHQALVPIALAAGLLADVLVYFVRPSSDRPARLRLVAARVPLTYYAL
jgi:hypothetical protein